MTAASATTWLVVLLVSSDGFCYSTQFLSPYIRRLIPGAGTGVLLVTSSCG
jgi:hypothetical protein